jgi:hypothetical protein
VPRPIARGVSGPALRSTQSHGITGLFGVHRYLLLRYVWMAIMRNHPNFQLSPWYHLDNLDNLSSSLGRRQRGTTRTEQTRPDQKQREQTTQDSTDPRREREPRRHTRPPSSSPPCTRAVALPVACSSHIHSTPRKHLHSRYHHYFTYLLLATQQPPLSTTNPPITHRPSPSSRAQSLIAVPRSDRRLQSILTYDDY